MSFDRHGDIVFQQGVDEVENYILIQLAREFKNSEAQWLAGQILDFTGVWGPNVVLDILWYDSSVPERAEPGRVPRHPGARNGVH
jgi:hypothetical protein